MSTCAVPAIFMRIPFSCPLLRLAAYDAHGGRGGFGGLVWGLGFFAVVLLVTSLIGKKWVGACNGLELQAPESKNQACTGLVKSVLDWGLYVYKPTESPPY